MSAALTAACEGLALDEASTAPILRFSAQAMITFFSYAGAICTPGLLLLLAGALFLYLRPPLLAIARLGYSPLRAHLARALALTAIALGITLLIAGGVSAGAAVPQAAFSQA